MVSQKNRKIAQHFGKFQHFWKIAKKAILYRKFLHENSTYRTNGVYHNVANGKCNKTINSEFWFLKLCHRDFFTESLSFFKNARNWKIFEMANLKSKNLCDKTLKTKNMNWQFCCIFRWLRHGILFFSGGAILIEKFGKQNCLFWDFSKNHKKVDFVLQITPLRMHFRNFF